MNSAFSALDPSPAPVKKTGSDRMTRRAFARRVLAASLVTGAPAFVRGQNLNNKLNIAFIACGGRANARLGELTIVPARGPTAGGWEAAGAGAGPPPSRDRDWTFA